MIPAAPSGIALPTHLALNWQARDGGMSKQSNRRLDAICGYQIKCTCHLTYYREVVSDLACGPLYAIFPYSRFRCFCWLRDRFFFLSDILPTLIHLHATLWPSLMADNRNRQRLTYWSGDGFWFLKMLHCGAYRRGFTKKHRYTIGEPTRSAVHPRAILKPVRGLTHRIMNVSFASMCRPPWTRHKMT